MFQKIRIAWVAAILAAAVALPSGVFAQTKAVPSGTSKVSTSKTTIPYTLEPLKDLANLKPAPANPKSIDDLKLIQQRAEIVAKYALPATVNIFIPVVEKDDAGNPITDARGQPRLGSEQGSGIIVSKDGYVLTAGHVSGDPGQQIILRLSNGTSVEAVTLGASSAVDSGMIKITTPGDYPFMPLGSTQKMTKGDWVVAMGHPGGWQPGRSPVMRLGKVTEVVKRTEGLGRYDWHIQTDCPLIMGDSGGPVFDLDGRVVGINSKIGMDSATNIHVPIDTYTETWTQLANSEKMNRATILAIAKTATPPPEQVAAAATLNAKIRDDLSISELHYKQAAENAGLAVGDIIAKFDNKAVKTFDDLTALVAGHKPGDKVTVEYIRDGKTKTATITLDAKGN